MTVDPKIEYKFKYYWGGEDNWYTKSKRWANEQKFPLNHLALGFIEFLWRLWVQGKVDMEMTSVDKQVNEIIKTWEDQENTKPIITSRPSEVEGLDDIRIKTSYSGDGDWNDASINHKKWNK
jgi:hypothetical protein